MTNKKRIDEIIARLEKYYPDAECALEAKGDAFRLLIMAILSAQCTDARVNIVSKVLFEKYSGAKELAEAGQEKVEEIIRPCGLYHAKAKNIRLCAEKINRDYNGQVPKEMEDLLSLPGVGRKIANLIRGDVFGLGGIVADTHCIRISGLLGFSDGKDPVKTERALCTIVPIEKQSAFCHRLVQYGRDVCIARRPQCEKCVLRDLCPGRQE